MVAQLLWRRHRKLVAGLVRARVRRQANRTSLSDSLSAVQAVSHFTSDEWIGELDYPAAVVITCLSLGKNG